MAVIMVVEDNRDTNEAVCEYLQFQGFEVFPAFDGSAALSIFACNQVDAVILDIMLPGMSGLDVLREIRRHSRVLVLMLTALGDDGTQIESFDALADDFMSKPFSLIILEKRVRALLRRADTDSPPKIWQRGDISVDFSGYCAWDSNGPIAVTGKEIDLLKMLVAHQDIVLSRAQILDGVWGDDSDVLERLVDTYIKNLRKKLRLDCIRTVKGIGYKLESDSVSP